MILNRLSTTLIITVDLLTSTCFSRLDLNLTAETGIILGYKNAFLSYRIFKLEAKIVMQVRNVQFEEFSFPGLNN
ncbi:putative signal peptide protein [Puccinia sorghi]|uniref:Putative signal peptide protein n=1 Tax=Puccinia sorghi TaxID=27349 RepID=A0A0L6U7Z3_9BASI|nr:putative signal peptide protein [Puccinia sorghi]